MKNNSKDEIKNKAKQRTWWKSGARSFYILSFVELILIIISIAENGWSGKTLGLDGGESTIYFIINILELMVPVLAVPTFILYRRKPNRWILPFIFALLLTTQRLAGLIVGLILLFNNGSTDYWFWEISGTLGILISFILLFIYIRSILIFRFYEI